MSRFNRLCAKVGQSFRKVGNKVGDTCDNAAASVRAKGLKIRIEEQYENLGRIVYRDLHTEENLEEKKLEIIAKIDALFDELEQIKAEKAARKSTATAQDNECDKCTDEACEECTDACEDDGETESDVAECDKK